MSGAAIVTIVWLLGAGPVHGQPAPATLPPAEAQTVDFGRDIRPILHASCARCHARGVSRGGFSIESREALLRGGYGGPAVIPGSSGESLLVTLVAGLDPETVMPEKGPRLKPEQVGLLRAWIDQGVAWDPRVSFARTPPRNLQPRRPPVPDAPPAVVNPVDRFLASYLAARDITLTPAEPAVLARRLHFDVVGLPPSPLELRAFVEDAHPDRQARLVRRLLADRARFAEHWLTFWNDALRNDYRGTGYIDGGRTQISAWLFTALATRLPYDRFVEQLVDPAPGAEGFSKGIVWRGVVNASERPEMQAAQNISQVFMGVNVKCASCHDSFVNDWQLADAYGMASVYADAPLEMVECDRPTGRSAAPRFLYPDLGEIDASAPRAGRVRQLAALMTSRSNGRLSRTIVNRLWAQFMGRGLVEPLDDMEQASWHGDLLDWLAEDLVAHGYDLGRTMEVILTSRAYASRGVDHREGPKGPGRQGLTGSGAQGLTGPGGQGLTGWRAQGLTDSGAQGLTGPGGQGLTGSRAQGLTDSGAQGLTGPGAQGVTGSGAQGLEGYVFRGPAVRRLTAEQFVDAVSALTGVWQEKPAGTFDFAAAGVEDPVRTGRTRAALTTADPLMTALGRPNREQVVTARARDATTLQALEIANGATLARMLSAGAERLLGETASADTLIQAVFERALGRVPTSGEHRLCRDLVGSPASREGTEDLLWAVIALPEFQLLR